MDVQAYESAVKDLLEKIKPYEQEDKLRQANVHYYRTQTVMPGLKELLEHCLKTLNLGIVHDVEPHLTYPLLKLATKTTESMEHAYINFFRIITQHNQIAERHFEYFLANVKTKENMDWIKSFCTLFKDSRSLIQPH